jgi:hypothetical protein
MTDPRRFAGETDVEHRLRDLALAIEYPPTPDLAAPVRARLTAGGVKGRRRVGWPSLGRSAAIAIITLLLLAGAAVAVGIGLRGLSIVFTESPSDPTRPELNLEEPVSLAEARERAPFEVLLPVGAIGEPEAVYVDQVSGVYQVTLLYGSREDAEAELLITQFLARPDTDLVEKQVGLETSVESITVAGEPAYWITGEPHVLAYLEPDGEPISDRVRLVGDVLLWQHGELTLRIEGAGSRTVAVEIAESMR